MTKSILPILTSFLCGCAGVTSDSRDEEMKVGMKYLNFLIEGHGKPQENYSGYVERQVVENAYKEWKKEYIDSYGGAGWGVFVREAKNSLGVVPVGYGSLLDFN